MSSLKIGLHNSYCFGLPLMKIPINMKRLGLLAAIALIGCQNTSDSANTENGAVYPIYEQIEMPLGNQVVYGVVIKDSSAESTVKAYQVNFKVQEKVWLDTLLLELPAKQMVQGEVIFGDAVVNDMGGASFEVKEIEID